MKAPSTTASDFDSRPTCASVRGAAHSSTTPRLTFSPRLGLAAFAALLVLLVASAPADAAKHLTVTGEYGKEGPKGSGVGFGCSIAYQSASHRLYLFTDGKIWGLNRTAPGSVSPLAGNFPLETGITNSSCYEPDLEVDNSAGATAGNIYAEAYFVDTRGWSSDGSVLSGWPAPSSNQNCGIGVTNSGEVWTGHYGGSNITKFSPDGAPAGTIALGFNPCRIAIDQTTNDVYVHPNGGETTYRLTAASGYTAQTTIATQGGSYPAMAVNGERQLLYVANGSSEVRSFDTETGTLQETINVGGSAGGIAIDEETDTLFIVVGSGDSGMIKEYAGVKLPKATTGDPTSDVEVSGTANPNGTGDITDCYFEFGPTAPAYGNTVPCSESTPIASTQTVHAILPGLSNESTYHYRLVVANATPESTVLGKDRTITPHWVSQVRTEPATGLTRSTATLHASFIGTGKDTHYYFDWGLTDAYGNQTPGADAGITNGPTSVPASLSDLQANTTYHYRVTASNDQGVSVGEDRTFKTTEAIKALVSDPASDIETTSAVLHGRVDPDGLATTYFFQYGKTTAYGQSVPVPPADVGDTAPGLKPVSFPVDGLESGATYHFRIVAGNVSGTTAASDDQSFATPQAPLIESFTSTDVTATSAVLKALINPNAADTHYHFEYGATPDYGSIAPVPDGFLPAGSTTEEIAVPLTGLNATPYHFRLVAESEWGTTTTNDQTFNFYPSECPNSHLRQQTGAGYLPDCRAYELVSPGNVGSTILSPRGPTSPVASSPSRFAFSGAAGVIEGVGDPQAVEGDVYISTRTNNGWRTRYVGLRGNEGTLQGGPPGVYGGAEGVFTNLSMDTLIDWDEGQAGYSCCGAVGSFAPYVWNVEGQPLGRWPTNVGDFPKGLADVAKGGFVGDARPAPDFSHYFFSTSTFAFAPGGVTDPPGSAYANDINTGEITVISKTPLGTDIPQDAGGPEEFIKFPAVSRDGSHVLMSTLAAEEETHLYMAVDAIHHYDISLGEDGLNHGAKFGGMTTDGETVYFTTPDQLTGDDQDSSVDLYRWTEAPSPTVTLVSTGSGQTGNSDSCDPGWAAKCGVEVVNINPENFRLKPTDNAVAADAGSIFFYSPELLDNGRGTLNSRNLYEYRGGRSIYVATMDDGTVVNRIQISPDGTHAAFLTASRLTSYDNAGHREMYSYDPISRVLLCVSCIPGGASPKYDVEGSRNGLFMSDDGRTFFATKDSLVEKDANGLWDTYEFVESRPQLISPGTSDDEQGAEFHVGLIGVSADGVDVYFSTLDTLVPQDTNGPFYKFYDARTGGGFQFTPPPAPCVAADECHGPPSEGVDRRPQGTTVDLGDGGNVQPERKKAKKKNRKQKKKKKTKRHARHGGGNRG